MNGSADEEVFDNTNTDPEWIALDSLNCKMYWTDHGIFRANMDGTDFEELDIPDLDVPKGIALDVPAGKMYWTDSGTDKIRRADLDGWNPVDLITDGLTTAMGIALDLANQEMYWADNGDHEIERANLDGSDRETIVSSTEGEPFAVALDLQRGKIYWTEWNPYQIMRSNLDGSNVELVIDDGGTDIRGIAIDPGRDHPYWVNARDGAICRVNIPDGSGRRCVLEELGIPLGIALDLGVSSCATNWLEAKEASVSRSYSGLRGHLVTITSQEEQEFIVSEVLEAHGVDANPLVGGYQDASEDQEPDGGWNWLTCEDWDYTNWHSGEPNDNDGREDALELKAAHGWQWNDLPIDASRFYYVIEFDEAIPRCVRDPIWVCEGDVDGDGQVNPVDSGLVQASFCSAESCDAQALCQYDMDRDGQINPVDAGLVQSLFGICDEPSSVCIE